MIPNFDKVTGIHYGVVNANKLNPEKLEEIIQRGKTGRDVENEETLDEVRGLLEDLLSPNRLEDAMACIEELLGEEDINNDGATYSFEGIDGVSGHYDTNNNIVMIYKSDYFTMCRLCSPCYPNAGDLDSFDTLGFDTYSPPLDWWDAEDPPLWKNTRRVSTRGAEEDEDDLPFSDDGDAFGEIL